jgi:hypothetical protein
MTLATALADTNTYVPRCVAEKGGPRYASYSPPSPPYPAISCTDVASCFRTLGVYRERPFVSGHHYMHYIYPIRGSSPYGN